MKPKRSFLLPVTSAVFGAVLFVTHSAFGQTASGWRGGTNSDFQTSTNWDNNFGSNFNLFVGQAWHTAGRTGSTTLSNGSAYSGYRLNFENISGGANQTFILQGSAITLFDFGGSSPAVLNSSNVNQILNAPLVFNPGSQGANGASLIQVNGASGGNLTFGSSISLNGNGGANVNQLRISGANGNTVTFGGIISNTAGQTGALNSVVASQGSSNITVVYNAANTYNGDTFIDSGTLQFGTAASSVGSANSSTLRLGQNASDSPAATINLATTAGGINVGSTIVIRPSSSGTQGTRTLSATNTSGTNTFSGTVALDAVATITSTNLGGTLAFTGSTLELKTFGLLVNGAGNTTISNLISSTGAGNALTKSGSGTLALSNAGSNYTGGTTITGGTLELKPTSTNAPVVLSGATSLLGNLGTGGSQITINGGTLKLTPNGTGVIGANANQQEVITFGSSGGTVYYNGNLTSSSGSYWGYDVSAGSGVVQLDRAPTVSAWDQNSSLFVGNNTTGTTTPGLKGGSSSNIRFELSNGALMTLGQSGGFTDFTGTLTVKGHSGGSSAAANAASNVGRLGLTNSTNGTVGGGFVFNFAFQDAVQVTAFGNPRTIDGNISLASNADVAFFGRANSGTGQLTLGSGANDTITINSGAQANLDWNVRTDAITGYNGVVMNARADIKAGGTLRLRQTATVGGAIFATAANIDGDIIGNGTTAAESLFDIADSVTVATSGNGKFIFHATPNGSATNLGADLIVNGAGNSGLKVQGKGTNLATAAGALTAARLAAVSGTGGYLTIAQTDGTYTLPASSQWSAAAVGFKVTDSYASGTDVTLGTTTWARDLYIDTGATLDAAGATIGSGTNTGDSTLTNATGRASVILKGGTINGAFTLAGNVATEASATPSIISNAVTLSDNRTFSVAEGAAVSDLTVAGAIGGGFGLTKTGDGMLMLSATNTYTGNTTVSNGTLLVDGSLTGTGIVAVASGAFLGGSGTIAGATTIEAGGIHTPGNSPGIAKFTSTLTYADASIFAWDIQKTGDPQVRGADYDGVNVSGALVATTDAIFRIVIGDNDFSDTFWSANNHMWTDIFTGADGETPKADWTDIFGGGFQYYNGNSAVAAPTTGSFSMSGNTLSWNFSAVPEPSSAFAGLLLGAGLLRRCRRG